MSMLAEEFKHSTFIKPHKVSKRPNSLVKLKIIFDVISNFD